MGLWREINTRMSNLRATFRDLNTERDKNALPSGTSDIALNVTIDGTELKGRQGFGAWNTWLYDNSKVPLNATIATFSSGSTYIVVKVATEGVLYWSLVDANGTGDFTAISDKYNGHHASDRSWFFF